jgi:hypothetical protein
MAWGFETVDDFYGQAELLARHPYGVIEVADERFVRVRLRPFPTWFNWGEFLGPWEWYHRHRPGNRCFLYYNQPLRHRSYLALKYVVSGRDTTLGTFRGALALLDEIARFKRSDALLTDVANGRISARLLQRWGWQSQRQTWWHRYYIKRFYGTYPPSDDARRLTGAARSPLECAAATIGFTQDRESAGPALVESLGSS